jgi:hypothetical protein
VIETFPLDVLHREPGRAVVGDAAVEQAGDVTVLQPGENPALLTEPPDE